MRASPRVATPAWPWCSVPGGRRVAAARALRSPPAPGSALAVYLRDDCAVSPRARSASAVIGPIAAMLVRGSSSAPARPAPRAGARAWRGGEGTMSMLPRSRRSRICAKHSPGGQRAIGGHHVDRAPASRKQLRQASRATAARGSSTS
jgi:hypothetical protein